MREEAARHLDSRLLFRTVVHKFYNFLRKQRAPLPLVHAAVIFSSPYTPWPRPTGSSTPCNNCPIDPAYSLVCGRGCGCDWGEDTVSVMCCQHVNRPDALRADSVTHAPSVLTQTDAFLFNLTHACIKEERRWNGSLQLRSSMEHVMLCFFPLPYFCHTWHEVNSMTHTVCN